MASSPRTLALPKLPRVELFRLLSEEGRLQLLALCHEEELTVGELAELLADSQPQISRRAHPLRQAGLLSARKEGTRTLLRTQPDGRDAVLADALLEGRRLCEADGSLARIPRLLAEREEKGRALFEEAAEPVRASAVLTPQLAHLCALGALLPGRKLAVDAGAGEGLLLDVLAPLYERVLAVERSPARLAHCAQRVAALGLSNVSLFPGSYEDSALLERVDRDGGADLVFASRTLHHASRPAQAVRAFARLLKKGGRLLIVDYLPHQDEAMREGQGDVWLGFPQEELFGHLENAGLTGAESFPVPAAFHAEGPDAHLPWQVFTARKPQPVSPLT